jgi:hypothetical protein
MYLAKAGLVVFVVFGPVLYLGTVFGFCVWKERQTEAAD